MSFKFGVLFLVAGFCLISAPLAAAEPASVETAYSPLQGPGFSPAFNFGSVVPPISVPDEGAVAVQQPAVMEMDAAQPGIVEPRRPVVVTENPVVEPEAALGRDQLSPLTRAAHPVIVVELDRGISFERLRRMEHRYPDQGMGSRFLEMGTELPPLFGEESF